MTRKKSFRTGLISGGFRAGKGLSLPELLISMIIVLIVGSAATGALWFALNIFTQTDDYTNMSMEMEFAVQKLSREFTSIGLGMPNNRQGAGSFASSFTGPSAASSPIMARMGAANQVWGGPVTVGVDNPANDYSNIGVTTLTSYPGGDAYIGPELYYAWAVPTGVKVITPSVADASSGFSFNLDDLVAPPEPGVNNSNVIPNYLQKFHYDGRNIGFPADGDLPAPKNPAGWFVFPTLKIPLLVSLGPAGYTAQIAPNSPRTLHGVIMGLDEIHLVRVARLRLNKTNAQLEQIVFGHNFDSALDNGNTTNILASEIVALQFVYNPTSRLLTMFMAARGAGDPTLPGTGQPTAWPSWLEPIPNQGHRRVLMKTVTWRIRN